MTQDSLGVAVIGVGMVGRAHAAGYRTAASLFDITDRPDTRLVAIADAYEPFAVDAAKRFGYERSETSWQAIVDAPDIDVVSVAIANSMHRQVVEALLAAGKHVLCEKPLAPSVEDAKAMVAAAEAADHPRRRRLHLPADAGDQRDPRAGPRGRDRRGAPLQRPLLVRLRTEPGQPDQLALPRRPGQRGAGRHRQPHDRPRRVPLRPDDERQRRGLPDVHDRASRARSALTVGHAGGEVGDEKEAVDNEDIATFTATFANGSVGTFSISRVAHGLPNGLGFEVFAETGLGGVRPEPPGRVHLRRPRSGRGRQRSSPGAARPATTRTSSEACRWTSRRSATARTTSSPGRHVPSWTRWPGSTGCPPYRRCAHGLHNMEILAAVTQSALNGGQAVSLA